jgi:hypothetical protein
VVPRSLAAVYRLRGLLPELFGREAGKVSPELDRYTAEMVAEQGAAHSASRFPPAD